MSFPNKALRILLVSTSLILLAGAMLGPIYALFVKDLGGTVIDAGLTFGVFALAAGITTLVSGHYSDKIKNREKVVVFGYFLMGVGFFLFLAVDSIWSLFVVQGLIGIGEAIYAPAFDALYSKNLDKDKEASGWAAWEASYYFATAIGAPVGGFLVYYFGFGPLFVIMGLLCFMAGVLLHFLKKRIRN